MSYQSQYASSEPARDALSGLSGWTLLEFGAPWCGHCVAAQPAVEALLSGRADLRHVKVEDGRGKPLGRAFGVKLWPTLVLLRAGEEVVRAVRPTSAGDLASLLHALARSDEA